MNQPLLSSLLLLAALAPATAQAEYPEALWAGRLTGVQGGDILNNMIVDANGDMVALSYIGSNASTNTMSWMGKTLDGISFDPSYNGTSTNKNAVITKHDPATGEIIWTAYSYSGDWINTQGAVRATPDGGYVYATKVRVETTSTVTDDSQLPVFVDTTGEQYTLEAKAWHKDGTRFYNVVVLKLDADGALQWIKTADVDADPVEGATSAAKMIATSDGIDIDDVAVDDSGNVYVGGRIATAITFAQGATFTSTCSEGWDGDSQTTRGNLFIAKYDSNGNYQSCFMPEQAVTAQKILSLDYKDGKILLCGYIKGTEETQFALGEKTVTINALQSLLMAQLDESLNVEWATSLTGDGYQGTQVFQNGRANYIGDEAYVALQWQGSIEINGETLSNTAKYREGLILCYDAETGAVKKGATSRATFNESTNIVGYHNVMQSPVSEDSVYVCGSWMVTNKGLLLRSYHKGDLETNGLTTYTMTSSGINATGNAVAHDGVIYSYFRPNNTVTVLGSDETLAWPATGYTIAIAAHRFADAAPAADADPTVWDGIVPAADAEYAFSGGEGTAEAPYIIATYTDLAQLAANVNGGTTYAGICFVQSADIKLNNASTDNEWPAIGTTAANSFQGTYDGQRFAIEGLRFTVRQNYSGLFGYAKGATLLNINIVDAYAYIELDNLCIFGALAGDAMGTTIINCSSTGDLTQRLIATNKSGYIGGLVGMGAANSGVGNTILNCYSYANLNFSAAEDCTPLMQYVAGISAQVNGNISNCFYGGTINFGIEAGAKYFASAIAANPNGSPTYSHNYYALGTDSTDGLLGINTAANDEAIDASNLNLDELTAKMEAGAQDLATNGYNGIVMGWTNNGDTVAFGDIINLDESGISSIVVDTLDINAPIYNAMGQRVTPSYRGIVIQNGQKFILR